MRKSTGLNIEPAASKSSDRTTQQKLTIACRHLATLGHESGLAGQITCRAENPENLWGPPVHLSFGEMTASDFIEVDNEFRPLNSPYEPNPATRFHMWIYRRRPDVRCIIHTHPPHTSALSMLGVPLVVSHMDATPFFEACAFLKEWPGVPVADAEGEIISEALGGCHSILLAHHGLLVTGDTPEKALYLAVAMERAAQLQLLAMAGGEIKPIPDQLAREARDFLLQPAITGMTFEAYARRVIAAAPDCLN